MSNSTVKPRAFEIIRSSGYVKRWFAAENFFNTKYTSGVLRGCYFITCDKWMSSEIWALRHMTGDGIDTVFTGNSKEECLEAMKELLT